MPQCDDEPIYRWRGEFRNAEVNALHAETFETRLYSSDEWDWVGLSERHSLGRVTARQGESLLGFANVLWDGRVTAWLQDLMVSARARRRRVGVGVVNAVRAGAAHSRCEFPHVDFPPHLKPVLLGRLRI